MVAGSPIKQTWSIFIVRAEYLRLPYEFVVFLISLLDSATSCRTRLPKLALSHRWIASLSFLKDKHPSQGLVP